jgi:hypothetical protein
VKEEVDRLLQAEFIQPCRYADWVFNIVPVEKKNTGKIWICVDFRNLNRATPKDEYPKPVANLLIDSASGNKVISFLDGNAGYNQIFMAKEDVSKTAFRSHGSVDLFEWVVMTFDLMNAGATYRRAMNLIFHDLLGVLMEAYINDVVVKSVGDRRSHARIKIIVGEDEEVRVTDEPVKVRLCGNIGKVLGVCGT